MKTKKSCKTLELNKILHMLSLEATSKEGKLKALEITPSFGMFEVEELLQRTNDAHMLVGRFGTPGFSALEDVKNSLRLAESGAAIGMADLLKVARTLNTFRAIKSWRKHSEDIETSLDIFFDKLYVNKYLEDKIKSCIVYEDEMADNASKELASIRKSIRQASDRARERLDSMTRSKTYGKYLQEPIVTIRNGRFVVPVKEECRGNIAGLVHDTSASGSTVFVEPMAVVEANNKINELKSKEKQEIERIIKKLSEEVGSFADSIIFSYNQAVELDVIFAKANLAYKMKASLPQMNTDGIIKLKKARHPLIDQEQVVATDIELGKDFDTLVITGPNTGGKTVTLKTIGLLSFMAMCGLMIPAGDNSKLSVFKQVLTDIGDEQSIEQSLSTFSSHMKNIIEIIEEAHEESLVLLDELGAGTDPVEGAALAMSILEELAICNSKIAATTHYAELKSYALKTHRVENACCEFDVDTLQPTYRLLIGMPGRSNAFAISKRLGLGDSVIERAKEHLTSSNQDFEKVIEKLENARREAESKEREYETLIAYNRMKKEEMNRKAEKLETDIESRIASERLKAKTIVDRTVSRCEGLLRELESFRKKSKAPTAEFKAKFNRTIKEMQEETDPIRETPAEDDYVLPRSLKQGDFVKVKGLSNVATVIKADKESGTVNIQCGAVKTRINIDEVRLTEQQKDPQAGRQGVTRQTGEDHSETASTEIDLRGMNSMDAVIEIDNFIDSAMLRGIKTITIIHGKGMGVLRREVQKHLKTHTAVKDFRIGNFGEGDSGVTVANLK